jgi:hypothetical protein
LLFNLLKNIDINPCIDVQIDVDITIHDDFDLNESDLDNVTVLRKGRKVQHKKRSVKKIKKASPKLRYTPNKWIEAVAAPFPSIIQNDRSHLKLSGVG